MDYHRGEELHEIKQEFCGGSHLNNRWHGLFCWTDSTTSEIHMTYGSRALTDYHYSRASGYILVCGGVGTANWYLYNHGVFFTWNGTDAFSGQANNVGSRI